ncbi:aminoacyl-tRNA hydrolase [candidate division NPL-UPA2 bacterium]|nr:aminoacyl-tRNA hydrolase [candidate division NPL-UPA2 bacterium]
MKLIVGLGNPGDKFKDTRHNVGFKVIDKLAEFLNIDLRKTGHTSLFGSGSVGGEKVFLVKPLTYMNKSGYAVNSLRRYYQIPLDDLLVIYDDADLEVGRVCLRSRGRAGGHRGVESVIACLGREDFPRLRIGIKGERRDNQLAEYVLKKFDKEERALIDQIIIEAAQAVELFIEEGITKAMNRYN